MAWLMVCDYTTTLIGELLSILIRKPLIRLVLESNEANKVYLHSTEVAAPGSILGIPKNLFLCCLDLSNALVRGKETEA